MEQTAGTQEFIEKAGVALERLGMSRTFGRLFGLLMVSDRSLSLGDAAGLLGVSKASISTNARLAEELGLVRRVSRRGDRRDYYEIQPECFERLTTRRLASIRQMADLAEEGLAAVRGGSPTAVDRLTEMRDFYHVMGDELEGILRRWREAGR